MRSAEAGAPRSPAAGGAAADLACAAALAAFAAVYWRAADALPTSLLSDEVGAAGLPQLLAIALAALAVALGARALLGYAAPSERPRLRPFGIVAIGFGYVALAPLLGYAAALALAIAAAMLQFGDRRPLAIGATAVLGAAALWLTFARMLGVSMPAGAWARLLG